MSLTNFKIYAETIISNHLDLIKSGSVAWNVHNQFDRYICESALECIESGAEVVYNDIDVNKYGYTDRFSAMTLAHMFSDFEVEEISSAWVD